jgi:hypothetical protein
MESPQRMRGLGKSKRLLWLAIPAALVLAVALSVVINARRALNRATQTAASEGQVVFTLRTLDTSNAARSLGAETVASHASYTTGAFFLGDLYLGGQSGLTILRADGTPRLNLRAGFESTGRSHPGHGRGARPWSRRAAASAGHGRRGAASA